VAMTLCLQKLMELLPLKATVTGAAKELVFTQMLKQLSKTPGYRSFFLKTGL